MNAPTKRGPLPPVFLLITVAGMVALHFLAPAAQVMPPVFRTLGAVLVLLGFAVAIWVNQMFKREGTTIRPYQVSEALVESGPFRYSRNPIYVAMIGALVGVWLLLGSLTPVLVIPLFAWVIATRFIPTEEQMLEDRFGDAYRSYKTRVRRWL